MRGAVVVIAAIAALGGGCKKRGHSGGDEPLPAASTPAEAEPAVETAATTTKPATKPTATAAKPRAGCNGAGDGVYLVSTDDELWRFDPHELPAFDHPAHEDDAAFTKLGAVHCEPGAHPFAMTMDRKGTLWIEYKGGAIYPVSIADLTCGPAAHPAGAPASFSMATVGDAVYVAGFEDGHTFGRLHLDASPPTYEAVGTVKAVHEMDPDLSGTADGRLFAFYPERRDTFVQEIEPATGAAKGRMHNLDFADVNTYATARWGAYVYLFVHIGSVPALYALDTKRDDNVRILDLVPFVAIGAGVSPCAPSAPD